MALTVWPSRKRSLSVGDNITAMAFDGGPGKTGHDEYLINEEVKPRRVRKRFLSKERRSVLSLHPPKKRDPSPLARLRDISPFRKKSFWSQRNSMQDRGSRAESLNRMFRRFRNSAGSEYTGLNDSNSSLEFTNEEIPLRNNNKSPPPSIVGDKKDESTEPLISELMA